MLKRYHHIIGGIFRLVDASVIGGAWLLSYWVRFKLPLFSVTKGLPSFTQYAALTPLVVILWMTVFSVMNVYQSRRMLRRTHEAHLLIKAHCVSLLCFIALTYLMSEYKYSRLVMASFGITGALLLIIFRLSLRNGLRFLRKKGFNLRHVLAVGEGGSLELLIKKLEKFPEMGFRVSGVLVHETSSCETFAGKPVLGNFNDIHTLLKQNLFDQILIALPKHQYGDLDRLLKVLHDETVDIQLVPDVHEYVTLGCAIEDFDGIPLVNLNDSPLEGWGGYAKRITDGLLACILLIVFSPLFLCISVLLKLSSRGSILYAQERMGLDGKTFRMLKFRSMRIDAELKQGAVWAEKKDPRRTAFGAFLRKTSLDELPQLWNVFKGEMSLVGPRPERPIFVKQFRHEIPHYMMRHKVKSGMTGWAQVKGWRGNTSLKKRIECDLYYIRNWSYLFDLKILALTLWKGFINKNAY